MRNLSDLAKAGIFSAETNKVFLLLLTISHPSLVDDIRLVNDRQPLVSNGKTFQRYPFSITLPFQREDQIPTMKIQIDNVDKQIITAIRNIDGPLHIRLDVVVSVQPDILEASFLGFRLNNVGYDALVIEGDMRLEEILTEPFPGHSMTPQWVPGIFGQQ